MSKSLGNILVCDGGTCTQRCGGPPVVCSAGILMPQTLPAVPSESSCPEMRGPPRPRDAAVPCSPGQSEGEHSLQRSPSTHYTTNALVIAMEKVPFWISTWWVSNWIKITFYLCGGTYATQAFPHLNIGYLSAGLLEYVYRKWVIFKIHVIWKWIIYF